MRLFIFIGLALVVAIVIFILIIIMVSFGTKKQFPISQTSNTAVVKALKGAPDTSVELPFKYMVVPGQDALDTVKKYRSDDSSPAIPVIMGDKEQIAMLTDVIEYNKSTPEEIIKDAQEINISNFLKEREEENPETLNDPEIVGVWSDDVMPATQLTAYTDILTGKPLKEVYIGLVPAANAYEIPAYVKYGGWNACPGSEEHVAIMKYWHQKYGANIISITGDTIECTVDNPPTTKEEAMALAREQFLYCEDIITQGCGSVSALAGTLLNSKYWYFWWD